MQGDDLKAETIRDIEQSVPIPTGVEHEAPRKITSEERDFEAYKTLRNYRAEARYEGARKVRQAKVSIRFRTIERMSRLNHFAERRRGSKQEEINLYPYWPSEP